MRQGANKIGVFDSGCGGVSFLIEAVRVLPEASFIYLADFANAPYGTKSQEEIRRLTLHCGRKLYEQGVGAIVMACNTATTLGVNELRLELNIPVVSMEPAIKPALLQTQGDVLCLATNATVAQQRYLQLLDRLDINKRVVSVGASALVGIVDSGKIRYNDVAGALDKILENNNGNFGAVVLGCTHFIFVKKEIEQYFKEKRGFVPTFFDGNLGTANQLKNVLIAREIGFVSDSPGVEFISTGGNVELLQYYYKHYKN